MVSPIKADEKTLEQLPSRSPSTLEASDLAWGKRSPYGSGDDFKFSLSNLTIDILGDTDFSVEDPDEHEVLTYDGAAWVSRMVGAASFTGDYGDFSCAAAVCSVNANSVALGTDTTGSYALGDAEAGAATTGDNATAFFSAGSIEDARIPDNITLALESAALTALLDDEIFVGNGAGTGTFLAFPNCVDATEKVDWNGSAWTCIADAGGAAAVADKIEEGDSRVEVIDAGTGAIEFVWDGFDIVEIRDGGFRVLEDGIFQFAEDAANGVSAITFGGAAALAANRTCVLVDAAGPIPSTCINPPGADTQVLFNDAGVIAGDAGLLYNKTTNALSVGGDIEGSADVRVADQLIIQGPVTDRCISNNADFPFYDADCDDTQDAGDDDLSADDDEPESGDFGNLTAGRSLAIAAGTLDADQELYEQTKCINIDPAHTTTNWLFFRSERAITVIGIDCLVDAATSVVLTLQECNSNGASCGDTEAAITCAATNTTEAAGIDDAAVDAGDWMRVTRGTVTGTITQASLCVTYTVAD